MGTIVISITEDGDTRCLVSPDTQVFLSEESVIRRASNVLPVSIPLRVAFRVLRTLFGEYGRAADYTRHWHCMWQIDLAPIGGPVLPDHYRNRTDAIDAEVNWLQRYWI